MKPSNPFRIGPALQFGLLFTAVVFISKWATVRLGLNAFYGTAFGRRTGGRGHGDRTGAPT